METENSQVLKKILLWIQDHLATCNEFIIRQFQEFFEEEENRDEGLIWNNKYIKYKLGWGHNLVIKLFQGHDQSLREK